VGDRVGGRVGDGVGGRVGEGVGERVGGRVGEGVGSRVGTAQRSCASLLCEHTMPLIQFKDAETRAYPPGLFGLAQPVPKEAMPTCKSSAGSSLFALIINGPPESPWHESFPPPSTPAQIIKLSLMKLKYEFLSLQSSQLTTLTSTSLKRLDALPVSEVIPNPKTETS